MARASAVAFCCAVTLLSSDARTVGEQLPRQSSANELPELLIQASHSDRYTAVAFSPDANFLATASRDGTVKLWDLRIEQLVHSLSVSRSWVHSVVFSPNGAVLAVGDGDNDVTLWDTSTGLQKARLQGHAQAVTALAYSPDGMRLASGGRDSVTVWDARSATKLYTFKSSQITASAHVHKLLFVDAHRFVGVLGAFPSSSAVVMWDAQSGRELRREQLPFAVYWSQGPRYGRVLSLWGGPLPESGGGPLPSHTMVWDVESWKGTATAAPPDAFRIDQVAIVGVCASRLGLKTSWPQPNVTDTSVAGVPFYSDRGERVAMEQRDGRLVSGECDGLARLTVLGTPFDPVRALSFSPTGRELAVGSRSGKVRLLDLTRGEPSTRGLSLQRPVKAVRFRDPASLVVFEDAVSAWDLPSDRQVFDAVSEQYSADLGEDVLSRREVNRPAVPGPPQNVRFAEARAPNRRVAAIAVSGQGAVAYAGVGPFVRIWYPAAGISADVYSASSANGPVAAFSAVAFTSDDRFLVGGTVNGQVIALNLGDRTQTVLPFRHSRGVAAIATSPTNARTFASAGTDGSLTLSSVASQDSPVTINAHTSSVRCLAYSPDGTLIVTGSSDGELRVWGSDRLEPIGSIRAHSSAVNAVTFSPDGQLIATGGEDGALTFLEARGLTRLASVAVFDEREWFVFTPDGFFDGTASAWQRARFRFMSDPLKIYAPEQFFTAFFEPGLLSPVLQRRSSVPALLRRMNDQRAELPIARLKGSQLPQVGLSNVRRAATADGWEAAITVRVRDTGSGMQDLRVFRNGTLASRQDGALTANTGNDSFVTDVQISLGPGANEVTAHAFNRDGLRSPATSSLKVEGAQTTPDRVAYIIGIGLDRYRAHSELRYAEADVNAATASLAAHFDGFKRVVVPLLSENATGANLEWVMKRLREGTSPDVPSGISDVAKQLRRARPQDAVVFYFAGHSAVERERFYLLMHDYAPGLPLDAQGAQGTVSDVLLERWFRGIDASNILVVLDSCFSGQVLESEERRLGPFNARGLAQLVYDKGIYLLAAAQPDQTAVELSSLGHGLLTHVLIKQGLDERRADNNPRDGTLTMSELLDFASGAMSGFGSLRPRGAERVGRVSPQQSARAFYPRTAVDRPWLVFGPAR